MCWSLGQTKKDSRQNESFAIPNISHEIDVKIGREGTRINLLICPTAVKTDLRFSMSYQYFLIIVLVALLRFKSDYW